MHLIVTGASHHTAPLAVRERLSLPSRELPELLSPLRVSLGVDELAVLSTCNRTEFYLTSPDSAAVFAALLDFLSFRSRLPVEALRPHLYQLEGARAIQHLFRVTAGLDSMILGESEITAQVKHAYQTAQAQGVVGPALNRLFQKALHAVKEVRSKTAIGEGQVSVGSVVTALAREQLGLRFAQAQVLLWGAGKAAEATARHLIKQGVRRLAIVNRTQLKAQDLASLCQGGWILWEQAVAHLAHVDIAIVCTQAPHYVIDADDVRTILPHRGPHALCLIDLAVPRNVDPAVKSMAGVRLYNIDDVQSIAQGCLVARQEEAVRCQRLIERQVEQFHPHTKNFGVGVHRRSPLAAPKKEKEVVAC